MTTITIDGIAYDLDTLTADAKVQAAAIQTARMAYSKALGEVLLKS